MWAAVHSILKLSPPQPGVIAFSFFCTDFEQMIYDMLISELQRCW